MSTLLGPYLDHMRAAGFAAKTVDEREKFLRLADQRLPYGLDTPASDELTAFLSTPDWAPWTRATYYRHLAGLYRWATAGDRPRLDWNPCLPLKAPRNPDADPDPVTDDELRYALAHSNARWQIAILLGAYAGLRAGEITRLKREHVNADHITIWHGKGNRTLKLPTHPVIWQHIQPLPPGLVFTGRGGRPVKFPSATARDHFNRIGLYDVHLHRLRHWYACMLLRQGTDIRTVQALMRHRSLETTARYLALVDGQRRLAVDTLPVLTDSQDIDQIDIVDQVDEEAA